MMRFPLLIFVFFVSFGAHADAWSKLNTVPDTVSGKVSSNDQRALAGATVAVFAGTKNVAITKTDADGLFRIVLPPGATHVMVSFSGFISYAAGIPSTGILNVKLTPLSHELAAVTVTTQKPIIEQQFDRTTLHVDGKPNAGINAADLLKKIPGLAILNNDEIRFEGKSATVYIDGKPSRLSAQDLMTLLNTISSTGISEVEAIHSPGAKYDAQSGGAVINIKTLKRERPGYDATVNLTGGHGWKYFTNNNAGLSINYRSGKEYLYGNYGYGLGTQSQVIRTNTYFDAASQYLRDTLTYRTPYTGSNARFGWDHFFTKDKVFGFLITAYHNHSETNTTTNTGIYAMKGDTRDSGWQSRDENERKSKGLNANINFKVTLDSAKRKEWSMDADMGVFLFDNANLLARTGFDRNGIVTTPLQTLAQLGHTRTAIFSYKSDYTQKWKKGTLEAGIKASHVSIDNTFNSPGNSNDFLYRETILAAYMSTVQVFKAFTLQLGLRAEQTFTTGNSVTLGNAVERRYLNLFPNISAGYKLKNGSLSFSFAHRIARPNYGYLNPFNVVRSNYSASVGNPYLLPSFTNSYRIGYNLKEGYSFSVSYSRVTDVITDLYLVNDQSKLTTSIKANLNANNNIGANMSYSGRLIGNWSVSYSVGSSFSRYRFSYMQGFSEVKQVTGYTTLDNQFSLPRSWWLNFFVYGQTKVTYGTQVNLPLVNTSISGGKKLWDRKGNISLAIDDIFFSAVQRSEASYGNVRYNTWSKYDSRRIRLSFSYQFGNSKVNVRQRTSGSSDEQRRSL